MPAEGPVALELYGVGVRFEVPTERIQSFKEYALRRIKRQIFHRELWALRGVDLEIFKGEVFGIMGRNGAGKSTLLKVISRVLGPTEGRVIAHGNVAPVLELGAGFHPDLTGIENVLLNGTILGISKRAIQERMDEVMGFAELHDFANAPIRTYSSGMLARLGFSVATLLRPDILVLDEVLTVGDLGFQVKCLRRIEEFVLLGTTVVLVSHALETFHQHCTRIAWLDSGQIAAIGPPSEVVPMYMDAVAGPGAAP